MKKIVLVLFVLGLAKGAVGQVNVYHPFPMDSATWRLDYYRTTCSGYCFTADTKMIGDTMLNSIGYKKLLGRGGIRQDIPMKRVYYNDDTAEYILYDFNLSVGDTIPHTWWCKRDTSVLSIIQSIDSIEINGQWRKMFTLYNQPFNNLNTLIEGIGFIGDVLANFTTCFCSTDLVCLQGDGVLLLSYSSSHSSCDNLDGIHELTNEEQITLYPNPATSALHIESTKWKVQSISIYNVLGEEVISNYELGIRNAMIAVGALNKGIYFVEIQTEKGVVRKKVVIQ